MLTVTTAQTNQELKEIIALQTINLPKNISKEEAQNQGFVTVVHDFDILKKMNDDEPHVIAKLDGKVVGYCLTMTKKFKADIPVLVPMFDKMDELTHKKKFIRDYNYIVCGQVCVAKEARGQGVFDQLYRHFRDVYAPHYDLVLTEIATRNQRSIRAHYRVGFKKLLRYIPDEQEWEIVIWDLI